MTIHKVSSLPADYNTGYLASGRTVLSEHIAEWVMWFQGRVAKQRSRRALAQLDARLLEDAGISEKQRELELSRSFWD